MLYHHFNRRKSRSGQVADICFVMSRPHKKLPTFCYVRQHTINLLFRPRSLLTRTFATAMQALQRYSTRSSRSPYKYRFFNPWHGHVPALGVFVVCDVPFPFAFSSSSTLKVWAVSGRGDGLRPGSCPQDAHSQRFGPVLHSQQDQFSAHHTTEAASGKLTYRSLSPSMGDMPLR